MRRVAQSSNSSVTGLGRDEWTIEMVSSWNPCLLWVGSTCVRIVWDFSLWRQYARYATLRTIASCGRSKSMQHSDQMMAVYGGSNNARRRLVHLGGRRAAAMPTSRTHVFMLRVRGKRSNEGQHST